MARRFGVHGDDVAARFDEGRDIDIDRLDHQMNVEDLLAVRTQGLHHRRADGQIGDEMPVHDIDMNIVGTSHVDGSDLFAQAGEIRGKGSRAQS